MVFLCIYRGFDQLCRTCMAFIYSTFCLLSMSQHCHRCHNIVIDIKTLSSTSQRCHRLVVIKMWWGGVCGGGVNRFHNSIISFATLSSIWSLWWTPGLWNSWRRWTTMEFRFETAWPLQNIFFLFFLDLLCRHMQPWVTKVFFWTNNGTPKSPNNQRTANPKVTLIKWHLQHTTNCPEMSRKHPAIYAQRTM